MTKAPSAATMERRRREERYEPQMRRIAYTYQDRWTQPHRARDRQPLTDQQKLDNGRQFETTVAAWSGGRRIEERLAVAGDEALFYSRGAVRAGVITKVGRTNFEVMYVTPTALTQSLRHGWGVPVTRVSIPKGNVHTIRRGTV